MNSVKKIMAYFGMPLFFLLLSYGIIYFLFKPIAEPYVSIYNLINKGNESEKKDTYDIFKYSDEDYPKTVKFEDIKIPNVGSQYGRLIIESLDVDLPLYYGDDYDVLNGGLGQYLGSSIPGLSKPTLVAGHAFPFFKCLENIKEKDVIKIITNYGVFYYSVTHTKVANKNDQTAYDLSQNKNQLILYTCYNVDSLMQTEERLFVYAEPLKGTKIEGDPYEK